MDTNASSHHKIFIDLLKDLADFVDVSVLKLAFDKDGAVYLIGDGFTQKLESTASRPPEAREELRMLIAKHCARINPHS